jgi:hypothetical protein
MLLAEQNQFDLVPARWRVAVFPNQLSTQIKTLRKIENLSLC